MIWQITFYKDAAYKIVQIQHGFTQIYLSWNTNKQSNVTQSLSVINVFIWREKNPSYTKKQFLAGHMLPSHQMQIWKDSEEKHILACDT